MIEKQTVLFFLNFKTKLFNHDFPYNDKPYRCSSKLFDEYAEKSPTKLGRKVMLTEFTSLLRTGVHIRAVRSAHKMLLVFTSNRKDEQERKGSFYCQKNESRKPQTS